MEKGAINFNVGGHRVESYFNDVLKEGEYYVTAILFNSTYNNYLKFENPTRPKVQDEIHKVASIL